MSADRVIAIDGPAGSGKSTVARTVADKLHMAHLDTGAMYRGVAFAAIEAKIDLDDGAVSYTHLTLPTNREV